nr:retrovirus-related Pol polyprotein from transposon TNT 1-94 [Tanacetum cinerariifolium]
MINSIQNGDQPLPVIAQVSLAETAQHAPPTLKDPKFWTAEEKKTRKIDPTKLLDLCDALERQMRGSEYGEQDRKAAILYEYETFKAIEGELLLDTYLHYLQVINDLKKYGYKKGNYVNDALGYKKKAIVVHSDPLALVAEKTNVSKRKEKVVVSSDFEGSGLDDFNELKKITALLAKAFNRRKFYSKPTNNNLRTSSTFQSANKKQDDSDQEINANMVFMAQIKKVLFDSEASSSSADEKIFEVSYYLSESESESEFETSEYYDNSTNFGLFMNNDDDQEFFHDAIESASENFIENHIDSQKDYDKSDKRVEKANQQSKDFENKNNDLQDKYDVLKNQVNTFEEKNNEFNEQIKVLNEKNDDFLDQTKVLKDQLQVKHVVIDTLVECHEKYARLEVERYEYMIRYSALFDNDKQHRKHIADQEVLFDKMSVELVELDKHVRDLKNTILEKDFKISELEECVRNKDLEIEKCLECLNVCENKLHKMGQTNQTIHMIMPSKDNLYDGRKGIGFENPSYFEKAKYLRPRLYDEKVIGLGYIPMFFTHSDEALEIEKFKRSRENKIEFAYDYGNLNASYVNEKINFEDDYFQDIINPDFEKIDSPFQQTSSLKPYVSNIDTFSSVRIPKNNGVIWKKKGSSNTSNVDLSAKTQVNLQLQVQRVRTDNGTEFKNKTLAKFFDEVGITQQFSAAGTPQQNGVVERRNRTLVEAARTMLTFANLPSFIWTEAIATACFTQNRSIIHTRFDKTPYELMNKRKLNIKFFRVFGCRCYLLNDYEDVGKLKENEDIGVFVGYSKEYAALRIYNKRTRKIHESVNVNFDEILGMASKQFSLEPGLSNLNETRKSSKQSVSQA